MRNYIIGIVLICLAFLAGKYSAPKEVVIKTVEKVVVKEVEKINKDLVLETEEIITKDKTIKKTKLVDKSLILRDKTREESRSQEITRKSHSRYIFGLGYNSTDGSQNYSIEGNARLGDLPVFIGIQGIRLNNENRVLFKALMEF